MRPTIRLIIATLMAFFMTGCEQQPYGTLTVEDFERMYRDGVPVVDIRLPAQWKKSGVIEGSHLITIFDANNRFTPGTFDKIAEIAGGKDKPVILISQTGSRSGTAARIMSEQLGFTQVFHAASGLSGWEVHRKPLVPPPEQN